MAERVIEKMKAIKETESESELNSFWEKFKEHLNYHGPAHSWEFEDKIDELVHLEINRMLQEDYGIIKGTSEYSLYERGFLLLDIWRYIQDKAESEEIEGNSQSNG